MLFYIYNNLYTDTYLTMSVSRNLTQETNLDEIIKVQKPVYVYGNNNDRSNYESYNESNNDESKTYRNFCFSPESCISRRDMFKYLIKYFINYNGGDNTQNMARFLAKEMKCNCSDCDGDDPVGDCEIEIEYAKHFGNVVKFDIV